MWIAVALLGAAVSAVLSVSDKIVLNRYMPNAKSLCLLVGIDSLAWGAGALLIPPMASGLTAQVFWVSVVSVISGLAWGFSLVIYFTVLGKEEVSRASSIYHTWPVLVAILGVAFLGEKLTALQWLAVMATIFGAALISNKGSPGRLLSLDRRTFSWLMLASALAAVGQFSIKPILDTAPFWTVYGLRNIATALPFAVYLRKDALNDLHTALKSPTGRMVIIGTEVVYATFSVWLTTFAVKLGPVSLVSALIGTRSVFTFLYSVVLSSGRIGLLDESLDRGVLISKSIAIGMVVAGVAVISLL